MGHKIRGVSRLREYGEKGVGKHREILAWQMDAGESRWCGGEGAGDVMPQDMFPLFDGRLHVQIVLPKNMAG